MAKFIVGLTETAFFSVPVQAETKEEAEKIARHVIATEDYGADYVSVELSEFDDDPPAIEEVDDACFERFGGEAA